MDVVWQKQGVGNALEAGYICETERHGAPALGDELMLIVGLDRRHLSYQHVEF